MLVAHIAGGEGGEALAHTAAFKSRWAWFVTLRFSLKPEIRAVRSKISGKDRLLLVFVLILTHAFDQRAQLTTITHALLKNNVTSLTAPSFSLHTLERTKPSYVWGDRPTPNSRHPDDFTSIVRTLYWHVRASIGC